ncbi:MAG: hypothetical protein AMJ79_12730 [Phycisphaerae bacterium SM23_30]|nr:MAG: hypothetical protein AMJ79_12730 [Phycisphaerae bacterium SM23_30]
MTAAMRHTLVALFLYAHDHLFVIIDLSGQQLPAVQWSSRSKDWSRFRVNVRGTMNKVIRVINAIEQGDPQYIVLL